MLVVLLSEVGAIGTHEIQKLHHDSHHALKESGTVGAFQDLQAGVGLQSEAVAIRVDVSGMRNEDVVGANAFEDA